MSVLIESDNGFLLAYRASLLDGERDMAWAERSVMKDPYKAWILGRYVEADKANSNKQYWALADLQESQPSIQHSPLNWLHEQHIVGHFVDTEMMYPEVASQENPFVEALAVFYKGYFPTAYEEVKRAHEGGSLFFSMECIAQSITCAGDLGCGKEFAYDGANSSTYCDHILRHTSTKQLNKPHFTAGALIVPPVKPGWSNAEIHSLVANNETQADRVLAEVASESPHLSPREWEQMMAYLLKQASSGSN